MTTTFRITLKENTRDRSFLERKARYDVLVNGEVCAKLRYNTQGYIGGLPIEDGGMLGLPESSLSAWKKEMAAINRYAKQKFLEADASNDRLKWVKPTFSGKALQACFNVGGQDHLCFIDRTAYSAHKRLRGADNLTLPLFKDAMIEASEIHEAPRQDRHFVLAVLDTVDPDRVAVIQGTLPETAHELPILGNSVSGGPTTTSDLIEHYPSTLDKLSQNIFEMKRESIEGIVAEFGTDLVPDHMLPNGGWGDEKENPFQDFSLIKRHEIIITPAQEYAFGEFLTFNNRKFQTKTATCDLEV